MYRSRGLPTAAEAAGADGAMRIWIDMTAPAHVLVFRPVIARLRERGHEIHVTARDYAQTLQLLELHGIEHTAFGRHGGASRGRKLAALMSRTLDARRRASRGNFDLAVAHGSNDLALAAASLRLPAVNMFDYEFATQQHHIGCRLARRVLTPDSIPAERLARYGAGPGKLVQFPGLKEEYYLADFEPDRGILQRLGVDEGRVTVVLRPPPDVSLYHRKSNKLFPQVLKYLGTHPEVHAVVLPRTPRQRDYVRALAFPSLVVPDRAVDAQSLIARADLVVSAGGTMNREAVALGTPVYTTYGGRLGGVDEALINQGRLRPLTSARALELVKRDVAGNNRVRRDPGLIADMMLEAAA
jgi:predicted glycosyltransferase